MRRSMLARRARRINEVPVSRTATVAPAPDKPPADKVVLIPRAVPLWLPLRAKAGLLQGEWRPVAQPAKILWTAILPVKGVVVAHRDKVPAAPAAEKILQGKKLHRRAARWAAEAAAAKVPFRTATPEVGAGMATSLSA